ncbi:hypothetical protein EVAR_18402_1 [Eumeta japonica]|uniref:Uncharacterized protein n=1 Tax=Eumeta variegata TaxID=151549 RepID=A0A4C1UVA9_EUMVA|nr:hypothetical protein EVAR_18402_1 [Eumeta japonica]
MCRPQDDQNGDLHMASNARSQRDPGLCKETNKILHVIMNSTSITCSIPTHQSGNALVTPLKPRIPMGGGDHLLCDGSQARLNMEKLYGICAHRVP